MQHLFAIAALWLGLALVSALVAYRIKIPIAVVEICAGVMLAAVATHYGKFSSIGSELEIVKFLASTGALLLAFLAGTELEPTIIKKKAGEVTIVGLIAFATPFVGCTAITHYLLGWSINASLLTGIALSSTSIAVLYSVMLETGLNKTTYGKGVLGACFINDIGTLLALGLIFAPFNYKTLIFVIVTTLSMFLLPTISRRLTRIYGNRTAAIRTKWVMFVLFALGTLAIWAGSEAVLPAYIGGMMLAEFAADDTLWLRRIRTLTIGLLTPFYFIRAGILVSIPAILSAPMVFILLLAGKVLTKFGGTFPAVTLFGHRERERIHYSLLMSTGLTFGTICALYGLSHQLIDKSQYSFLVAAIIGSAILPTIIATSFTPNKKSTE